jgi:hypothetical protein
MELTYRSGYVTVKVHKNGFAAGGQNGCVPSFASYDGTEIGYRLVGDGLPLVCLPGGPGRAYKYLGDLGGLGR